MVFVGRHDKSKGFDIFRSAVKRHRSMQAVSYGLNTTSMTEDSHDTPNLKVGGIVSQSEVMSALRHSRMLVVCSRWYEGFPMVVFEAIEAGCQVVMPSHGPFREISDRYPANTVTYSIESSESLDEAIRQAVINGTSASKAVSTSTKKVKYGSVSDLLQVYRSVVAG